jgi:hypothetical protein
MAISPEARQALADLIRECGKSIVKMPSSGQLYITAKLGAYPDEKELFAEALRRGIPERILEHAGGDDYATKLDSMSRELAKARKIDQESAEGVVTAWAEALNRPVGYQKTAIPDRVYRDAPPSGPQKEKSVKLVMAAIAGAGGLLGAAIGAGLPGIIMLITELTVSDTHSHGHKIPLTVVAAAIAIKMGIAGVLSGFTAFFGWVMGGGDERPWAGFAAAFGSGFSMALILLSCVLGPIGMVIIAACVFGATFTASSRGGHKYDRRV